MPKDPMEIFTQSISNKAQRKAALQGLSTYFLVVPQPQLIDQMVPALLKILTEDPLDIKITVLQCLHSLYDDCSEALLFRLLEAFVDFACTSDKNEALERAYCEISNIAALLTGNSEHRVKIITIVEQIVKEPEAQIKRTGLKLLAMIFPTLESHHFTIVSEIVTEFCQSEQGKAILAPQMSLLLKGDSNILLDTFKLLVKTTEGKTKSNLIPALVRCHQLRPQVALECFESIVLDQNEQVACGLISNLSNLATVFSAKDLEPIVLRIKDYVRQPQQVKKCILECLPDTEAYYKVPLELIKTEKSLELWNSIANSLCQIQDTERLADLLSESNIDLKVKFFGKISILNKFVSPLMESIMAHKNWRLKVNLLENLINKISTPGNFKAISKVLVASLGDRVAIVRFKTLAVFSASLKLDPTLKGQLLIITQQLSKSKNWYERQMSLLLFKALLQQRLLNHQEEQPLRKAFESDLVRNVREMI